MNTKARLVTIALALSSLTACAGAYDPQAFMMAAIDQRCNDYRMDIASYNAALSLHPLTEAELHHLGTLENFVRDYCQESTS